MIYESANKMWRSFFLVLMLRVVSGREHEAHEDWKECSFGVYASATQTLVKGELLPCGYAIFGNVLPVDPNFQHQVVFASPVNGCSELVNTRPLSEHTIVVVKRGICAFDVKLGHVNALGLNLIMLLINSDDTPVVLGSKSAFTGTATPIATPQSSGKLLMELQSSISSYHIRFTKLQPVIEQWIQKIQTVLDQNDAYLAVALYFRSIKQLRWTNIITVDQALAKVLSGSLRNASIPSRAAYTQLQYYNEMALEFSTEFAITSDACLHAQIQFIGLLAPTTLPSELEQHKDDILFTLFELWYLVATTWTRLGYFRAAELAFDHVLALDPTRQFRPRACLIGKARAILAQGHVLESVDLFNKAKKYKDTSPMIGKKDLWVVQMVLENLSKVPQQEGDTLCVRMGEELDDSFRASGYAGATPTSCCAHGYAFQSKFVQEVYRSWIVLGVYFDEYGGFDESLKFHEQALHLCGYQTGLQTRLASALPIVFKDKEHVDITMKLVLENIDKVRVAAEEADRIQSSDASIVRKVDLYDPATTASMKFTITPTSMFLGYQGLDVLPWKRAVANLHEVMTPSISSLPPLEAHAKKRLKRPRIGFVSSYFRKHSVGKLIHGIVENLAAKKFEVYVFQATHFFRNRDEYTEKFEKAAAEFIPLPLSLEASRQELRRHHLDVLIFPEIGMDAWTEMIAHERYAPIQIVFWGHPISTGLDTLDYFISSELYIRDFHEPYEEGVSEEAKFNNVEYSEQLVLMKGIGAYFLKPLHQETLAEAGEVHFLPQDAQVFVCPQTLMKLHVDFDYVLISIIKRIPEAIIVFVYSDSQTGWKEKLMQRFRKQVPEDHHRLIFLKTLEHTAFLSLLTKARAFLDPFPFGGGVTALDAFAVGTPVITFPTGQTVVQLAAGFYRYMGITDGVVSSADEYIDLAINMTNPRLRSRVVDAIMQKHDQLYEDPTSIEEWTNLLSHLTS